VVQPAPRAPVEPGTAAPEAVLARTADGDHHRSSGMRRRRMLRCRARRHPQSPASYALFLTPPKSAELGDVARRGGWSLGSARGAAW
jgi:hypothetical protein